MKKKLLGSLLALLLFATSSIAIEQTLWLRLLELQKESYLAKKGEWRLSYGFGYGQDLINYVTVNAYSYSTSYNIPLSLSYGLTPKLELSLRSSVSGTRKKVSFLNTDNWYYAGGVGDTRLLAQYEWSAEKINRPQINITVGLKVPTAPSPYDNLNEDQLPLGNGEMATIFGLTFLKSADPCVVYWGGEYEYNWGRDDFRSGDSIRYFGGLSTALNSQINLSIGLSGAILREDQVIEGGRAQTVFGAEAKNRTGLVLGTTYILDPKFFIEPSIIVGLTDEEEDFSFSLGLTRKF
ncbi:transporter [Candidatus Saganbacteria bacterium]|nr:transporter [Candidatus Saganbacteria bacterium]